MKIELPKNTTLVRLPPNAELAIYLIREELRSRKLVRGLEQVGLDPMFSQADFSKLVLSAIGYNSQPDELCEWYYSMVDEYTMRFDHDDMEMLLEQSFNFYLDLEMERRVRKKKGVN
jgi:hypothetical protein